MRRGGGQVDAQKQQGDDRAGAQEKAFIDVRNSTCTSGLPGFQFSALQVWSRLRHTTVSIQLRLHCVKDLPGLRPADIRLTGCLHVTRIRSAMARISGISEEIMMMPVPPSLNSSLSKHVLSHPRQSRGWARRRSSTFNCCAASGQEDLCWFPPLKNMTFRLSDGGWMRRSFTWRLALRTPERRCINLK
jgi:hypothetical protein